ncbi:MAG: MFS transporter [Erysipelotrichales bacterium]
MAKWLKFALIYLGAFVISISQFKIAPNVVNDELTASLNASLSSIQLLSSIFAISGVFLALPGGLIMSKVGPKKLAIVLMACLGIGNIIGYFVTNNYSLLLITRILEGVSFAMFLMIAMVYIRHWFADSGSGLALGIFGTYSALAQPIIIGIAKPVVDSLGYRSLWLIIGLLAIITMVIYIFILEDVNSKDNLKAESQSTIKVKDIFSNTKIWILALAHGCMTFSLFTYLQYGPKILEQYFGASNSEVTTYLSFFGIAGVVVGIAAGIIVDKTQKPAEVGIIAFVLMFIYWISMFVQGNETSFAIVMLGVGVLAMVTGTAYTAVMILASGMSKKTEVTGYNVALVNTIYYAVIVIGAPLTTKVIEVYGWTIGFSMLGIISALGAFLLLIFKKTNKNTLKEI